MKYKYLPHTADMKFQAYGETLEETFSNAALAVFDFLTRTEKVHPKKKHDIELESENIEALLYDFLEEILILLDVDGFLLHKVESIKITKDEKGYGLKATVVGDDFDGSNYEVGGNIKSVTYNDMFVKKTSAGWTVQVVMDI